jgi:hypothetical protein
MAATTSVASMAELKRILSDVAFAGSGRRRRQTEAKNDLLLIDDHGVVIAVCFFWQIIGIAVTEENERTCCGSHCRLTQHVQSAALPRLGGCTGLLPS